MEVGITFLKERLDDVWSMGIFMVVYVDDMIILVVSNKSTCII